MKPELKFYTVLKRNLVSSMGALKGKPRTVMFSGGFDSMLMVLLAREYGAKVRAVTVEFEDHNRLNVSSAVTLARNMDLSHQIISVNIREFLSSFQALAEITEVPILDLDLALVHAAFKKYDAPKREVFISGMGSDQGFGDLAIGQKNLKRQEETLILHQKAHDRVAKRYGHRFIFPFLSKEMLALSRRLPDHLKENKKLLRMLVDGPDVVLPPKKPREIQVPGVVRNILVKAYGKRAWPHPIDAGQNLLANEQVLRQIVFGLWLERSKGKGRG